MHSDIDSVAEVPCFKCLLNKEVNPYYCKPEKCEKLDEWLLKVREPKMLKNNRLRCPNCGSTRIVKYGVYRYKGKVKPRFKCKECGTRFRHSLLKKFKTPAEIIRYALKLDAKGIYSTRDISKLIAKKFNLHVSHVTVSNWINNRYLIKTLK